MTLPAIKVENLSKRYRVGAAAPSRTLVDTISDLVRRLGDGGVREFWALKEVSFQIAKGEAVGLIGHNGAGKSTLLKILSRVTEPTAGRVMYRGRVGSLLEVGTGFHPQLSGRENIFLSGAALGMGHNEILRKFDKIVAFSGVETFIDEPIKHYSSGMYLRLAFAVAAHLDTDILLVDEVLAVGDVNFQKKCLSRMENVSRQGRTVLFVSHNLTAVQALCTRAIWLDRGKIAADGTVRDVLSHYLKTSSGFGASTDRHWPAGEGPTGGGIELRHAAAYKVGGNPQDAIDVKTPFSVEFEFAVRTDAPPTHVSLQLIDEQSVLIFDSGPGVLPTAWRAGLHHLRCDIPGDLLNDGAYRVGVTIHQGGQIVLELPDLIRLDILDNEEGRNGWFGKWPGLIRPRFNWTQRSEPV